MAFLISYAAQNNNRVTASMSTPASDGARKSSDYLPDDDATLNHATNYPAYYKWRLNNYSTTVKYFYDASAAAGLHKKYAHGPMWKFRKILKAAAKNRAAYNSSTTVGV